MIRYRASWILPIAAPPIADGWVAIEHGRVAGVGFGRQPGAIDLGHVAILPALVNAHTHLELSYLRGAVPPAARFLDWIGAIIEARARYPDPQAPPILEAARAGIDEARASGTGLVGDISNSLVTVPLLREAGMPARVFYELIGFNSADPARLVREARAAVDRAGGSRGSVRVALAPHAPYSVSPAILSAIRADLDAHPDDVSSVHLSESAEEVEFIEQGTGAWRAMLTRLGVWTDAWRVPGVSPTQYLADLGFLDRRVLAVHGVQCGSADLSTLRSLEATVVSCPRSNRYVGVGDPPLEAMYDAGVSVAFGTDSLASVWNLSMFEELAAARRLAPRVSARRLLESATLTGARALGYGDEFGSIQPRKAAALLAVRVPERVGDVEEYLVSGIDPELIQWVEPSHHRTAAPSHHRT